MDTYYSLSDMPPMADSALSIGTFDGLHRGHLAVIGRLTEWAEKESIPAAVITFDPHPQHILTPPGIPLKELIITTGKKMALLERAGVDLALVLKFDHELSRISAEDFLRGIVIEYFHPSHIVVGYDHHFGYQQRGDNRFLREHTHIYGFKVDVVEAVNISGKTVSSENIRWLIHEGRCEEAEELLGWPYEIPGKITRGVRRGRGMDFPTANLTPDEPMQLIPREGVYIVSADINENLHFGMCNVGYRPTFNGKDLTIETHFFNLREMNLYGQSLILRFHHRIRDEQKYGSKEELRVQLERDRQTSMEWIKQYYGGNHIHAPVN